MRGRKRKWAGLVILLYLGGWFGLWAIQKITGWHKVPIPGITHVTSECRLDSLSVDVARVAMPIKVKARSVLTADFLWFLPKNISSKCTFDDFGVGDGMEVVSRTASGIVILCRGKGWNPVWCGDLRWDLTCETGKGFRLKQTRE